MRRRSRSTIARCALTAAAFFTTGCARVEEQIEQLFAEELTPHERYAASLAQAGLQATALARDWLTAADLALEQPVPVRPPYGEDGFLAPEQPGAVGYRLPARRGQRLLIQAELLADSVAALFLDVFEIPRDSLEPPRHVVSADSGARALEFEPRRDGEYLLRFQPELLRGGRYTVTIRAEPALAFPVLGHGSIDIGSDFGDPRDGGDRDHHGIDIFAPRGTPALAATTAVVRRVETTPRGGNVVWLRDQRRSISIYYAHLDRQSVSEGAVVEPGDTVGFIGNTGNARTTPPHLHFGVYQRGPVDPYPFVYRPRATLARLAVDTLLLGKWARVARDRVALRTNARENSPQIDELARHTAALTIAGSGAWFRVRLPDGRTGFVAARLMESADQPIAQTTFAAAASLRAAPDNPRTLVRTLGAGEPVDVLGRFGEYLLVQPTGGRPGWVAQQQ
jgi:murein DD-endopeptidase MepM/ murein hydrolase activator NlpD